MVNYTCFAHGFLLFLTFCIFQFCTASPSAPWVSVQGLWLSPVSMLCDILNSGSGAGAQCEAALMFVM